MNLKMSNDDVVDDNNILLTLDSYIFNYDRSS